MKTSMIDAFELKRNGYYKQAIEIYYKLLSTLGDDVEILSELADLYYLLDNDERAVHYISKALEINPEHVSSLCVMRNIHHKNKNYQEAEKTAKQICTLTESETELAELIKILKEQGKNEEIISYTKNTTDGECLYESALALYHLKRYEEALNILDTVKSETELGEDEKVLNLSGKYITKEKM